MNEPQGEFWIISSERQKEYLVDQIKKINPSSTRYFKIVDQLEPRELMQNRYIWGWVYGNVVNALKVKGAHIKCVDGSELPYNKPMIDEIFKRKYLVCGEIKAEAKDGSVRTMEVIGGTAELTKEEFKAYLSNIDKFCMSVWQISIPKPTKGRWCDYYRELGLS